MPEVCHDVAVEPFLQPLSRESLRYATAKEEDEEYLDVSARGFWGGNHQGTFFDVQVFNPMASSDRTTAVSSLYWRFECAKWRMYEQRVREIEISSFTPLVFSTFRGIGGGSYYCFPTISLFDGCSS